MSQRTETDPNSSPAILVVIALAVVAAAAWVVWIVRQQQEPETTEIAVEAPAKVQPPSHPGEETAAAKCTRLWQANSLKELTSALLEWRTTSEAEVMTWLLQLPTGLGRDILFATLAPELPIAQRLDLAIAMQSKQAHSDLISTTLSDWAKTDATAALAWADLHASDPAFPKARIAMLVSWASSEPRECAAHLASQPKETLLAVITQWMQSNPGEAAAWAEALPDEAARLLAADKVLEVWLPRDESSAADWVEQIPPSALRDAALRTLAFHQAKTDIDAARSTAEQISDNAKRESFLKTLSPSTK